MAIDDNTFHTLLKNERRPKASAKIFDLEIPTKTEHKSDTNRVQTEHKPATNRTQTEHKLDTKITLTTNIKQKTGHKPDTKLDTTTNTNRTQIGHKPNTTISFSSLVGLQREVLKFLFYDCKLRGTKQTREFTLLHIAENTNIPIGSVKTTLKRLEEKGFILRIGFKNGRGGFSKYELLDEVYKEIAHSYIEHKPNTNWTQTEHKPDTKLDTQPHTISSSSSSNINNIKTTTTEGWPDFDIEPLTSIGFTKTHVQQIAQQGRLPKDIAQDAVYMFAFDLEHNNKTASIKGSPLNYFMGILRNGMPYAPSENYESPQDKQMRIYHERKVAIENQRAAREKQIIDLNFNEWLAEQTEEYKYSLLSDSARATKAYAHQVIEWRDFYVKEIWPGKLKEIMQK